MLRQVNLYREILKRFEGISEKFVFVLEISAVKVEELWGTNSRFSSFSEKYCRAIFVCDVTDDLYSEHEADFIRNTRILFPQKRAPRKFILKIFKEYFVVCPVELQGINNMLICPILSSYFSGSWTEYQCHNDHTLVVCDHVDGGIRLSGFVLAGFIANENVALPYFAGPWTDYQCHSETTSN